MTKPLVIKVGGAILEQKQALSALLQVLKLFTNRKVVLVHGGGSAVDLMLKQAGFITNKKNGLRITPRSHIPIVSGTLAGNVNKQIVALANQIGLSCMGLSLVDGQMVRCQKHEADIGEVGVPSPNDASVLNFLLSKSILPVIAPIGALSNASLVNVNADDAAVAICQLLDGELLLLTDVLGVQNAQGDLLESLEFSQAQSLIQQNIIHGGMVAKVNAAFNAARRLRRSIAIASWTQPQQFTHLLAGESIGTRIIPD